MSSSKSIIKICINYNLLKLCCRVLWGSCWTVATEVIPSRADWVFSLFTSITQRGKLWFSQAVDILSCEQWFVWLVIFWKLIEQNTNRIKNFIIMFILLFKVFFSLLLQQFYTTAPLFYTRTWTVTLKMNLFKFTLDKERKVKVKYTVPTVKCHVLETFI